MVKRNIILIGIVIGVLLLLIATFHYPGGTNLDASSEGYDWANNYISNLLSPIAINGKNNPARPWAILGVLFLTASFGAFFIKFSHNIADKGASKVIKYLGILATLFAFVTVVPGLHDVMVSLSSILTLIIFFYITILTLKSKLNFLKIPSVLFLLSFYLAAYMYFTRSYLDFLPIVQKSIFLVKIVWILSLEYFAHTSDFSVERKPKAS